LSTDVKTFYDDLAEYYHLIFNDWERETRAQDTWLFFFMSEWMDMTSPLEVLDCACGIGTQAIGMAMRTRRDRVTGTDLSPAAIRRAQREAADRKLEMTFRVEDMRDLSALPAEHFDLVLAVDNALPHLMTEGDLLRAAVEMRTRLKPGGWLVATIWDYDELLKTRPACREPEFFNGLTHRRFVHQVWDWGRGDEYDLHLYLTWASPEGWKTKHFCTRYRALRRETLRRILEEAGFRDISWEGPNHIHFDQLMVRARRE
jgi:glycine/sarcosine N-methyltransferase